MIKPILFNTDMVRAILDGRKTVTRRVIKGNLKIEKDSGIAMYHPKKGRMLNGRRYESVGYQGGIEHFVEKEAPYQPGDVLYVRETWGEGYEEGIYIYKADDKLANLPEFKESSKLIYHPSIHMPKEAARIFLKVKDVRVERLQDMSDDDCEKEGLENFCKKCSALFSNCDTCLNDGGIKEDFKELWNSTINKSELDRYGWDANPWVWVIEFERCERPEGWC